MIIKHVEKSGSTLTAHTNTGQSIILGNAINPDEERVQLHSDVYVPWEYEFLSRYQERQMARQFFESGGSLLIYSNHSYNPIRLPEDISFEIANKFQNCCDKEAWWRIEYEASTGTSAEEIEDLMQAAMDGELIYSDYREMSEPETPEQWHAGQL